MEDQDPRQLAADVRSGQYGNRDHGIEQDDADEPDLLTPREWAAALSRNPWRRDERLAATAKLDAAAADPPDAG